MADNTKLKITELDFDTIKTNLKTHLNTQSQFTDYDFDGSAMSILLDILAYNTHYQSFYSNMVSNEMFLDSAVLRNSVVSIAKHLGYIPRSVTAARAVVNVTNDSTTDPGTLEKGDTFTCVKDGQSYIFTSLENVKYQETTNDAGTTRWVAKNVDIGEGSLMRVSFVHNPLDPDEKFIIPDSAIDTSTIEVRVQTSITDESGADKPWKILTDFNSLNSNSRTFFLQEVEDGKFEVYFGDGIAGKKLSAGNVITITYLSTNGPVANNIGKTDKEGARTFSYVPINTYTTEVITPSIGGAERESIDSIKFMAPKFYHSQNRAVTVDDYKTILTTQFSDIEAVYVWGGEDNDPPMYGKIFISVKPISGTLLTSGQKRALEQELKRNQAMAGMLPEVVDPDYVYLKIDSVVKFDPDATSNSANAIARTIVSEVLDFGDVELEKFERNLRFKDLITLIEKQDTAIKKSDTTITLQKRLVPVFSSTNPYILRFGNKLLHPYDGYQSIINSSKFSVVDAAGTIQTNGFLKDDGHGKVSTYYLDASSNEKLLVDEQGTLDYNTGKLTLNGFTPIASSLETYISITAVPDSKNIRGERNQILIIDRNVTDSVTVNVSQETSYETSVGSTSYTAASTVSSTSSSSSSSGSSSSSSNGGSSSSSGY